MKAINTAYALVDWHNMQKHLDPEFNSDPRKRLRDVIFRLQQHVVGALEFERAQKYRVTLRLYHGWHQNRDQTVARRDFDLMSNEEELARRIANVSFVKGFQFGNDPICNDGSYPLFHTYRGGGQDSGQKMIDTSIVCDALHLMRYGLAQVVLVLSDDDDFIPLLVTAKSWAARAILLRQPGSHVRDVTDLDCENDVCYWSEN
ncbi:hypothetical protein RDV84_22205 [Lysobacter yananisis]|uniref:NYN domain-containing protein n=1 Tax=Lysobacter yananisis TaxID=1003114 RepID=A0ABY9P6L9_9GAMM|nr:hypothetical protein [Lysobacter yananisis]WMT02646.1 hypothetical protein RDV84_22205 [Lysobacter yananisis]